MQCALFPLTALAHLFLIIIMFCLLFCCFHHCYLPLHFALFVCYYYMPVDSVVSAAIPLLLSSCCSAKVFHSHSSAAILCLLFALFSFLLSLLPVIHIQVYAAHIATSGEFLSCLACRISSSHCVINGVRVFDLVRRQAFRFFLTFRLSVSAEGQGLKVQVGTSISLRNDPCQLQCIKLFFFYLGIKSYYGATKSF